MTAHEPILDNFLFPALLVAIVLVIFLLQRTIVTERLGRHVLNEAKNKVSSLTTQQEEWAETIQKTQEKLVMMFLVLEETKKQAGLLSPAEEGALDQSQA